ncbi:hypothetical protein DFH09DRAFT_1104310 [Mycena vulgaris]|nr:hypothetical protein DFH09DRAFT_1104310 [Mycena vulgaris]
MHSHPSTSPGTEPQPSVPGAAMPQSSDASQAALPALAASPAPAVAAGSTATPAVGFLTRGPWVVGSLYQVVPTGPLIAIAEEATVVDEDRYWYCITRGRLWCFPRLNEGIQDPGPRRGSLQRYVRVQHDRYPGVKLSRSSKFEFTSCFLLPPPVQNKEMDTPDNSNQQSSFGKLRSRRLTADEVRFSDFLPNHCVINPNNSLLHCVYRLSGYASASITVDHSRSSILMGKPDAIVIVALASSRLDAQPCASHSSLMTALDDSAEYDDPTFLTLLSGLNLDEFTQNQPSAAASQPPSPTRTPSPQPPAYSAHRQHLSLSSATVYHYNSPSRRGHTTDWSIAGSATQGVKTKSLVSGVSNCIFRGYASIDEAHAAFAYAQARAWTRMSGVAAPAIPVLPQPHHAFEARNPLNGAEQFDGRCERPSLPSLPSPADTPIFSLESQLNTVGIRGSLHESIAGEPAALAKYAAAARRGDTAVLSPPYTPAGALDNDPFR